MNKSWTTAGSVRALSAELLRQAHELDNPEPVKDQPREQMWTFESIRKAAKFATGRCRLSPSAMREVDLLGIAMSGVGLAVAIDPNISWDDAVIAGQNDIWDVLRGIQKTHSRARTGQPGLEKQRWWKYWLSPYHPFPDPDRCEEALTLVEVLADLPAEHLDTLLLAAFSDSTRHSAEAAGVGVSAFNMRLRAAREKALMLWFDQERPPSLARLSNRRKTTGRTCPQGHLVAGDNVRIQKSRSGRITERCATCSNTSKARARARAKQARATD